MYTNKRLSGIRRMKSIENLIDYCAVLSDDKRTFDGFQSFVVALAKSQDRREIYGVFCFWRPYSTRKQSVCMDGLEVNTAHLYTRVQNVTELGLGIGKAIGSSGGKLGQLYKRINPSSALGLFVYLR